MYNPSESKLDTISWEDLEKEFPEITKSAVYHEAEKYVCENEIDKILSKIGKNGLKDLSTEERKRLDELSKKIK